MRMKLQMHICETGEDFRGLFARSDNNCSVSAVEDDWRSLMVVDTLTSLAVRKHLGSGGREPSGSLMEMGNMKEPKVDSRGTPLLTCSKSYVYSSALEDLGRSQRKFRIQYNGRRLIPRNFSFCNNFSNGTKILNWTPPCKGRMVRCSSDEKFQMIKQNRLDALVQTGVATQLPHAPLIRIWDSEVNCYAPRLRDS